MRIKRLKAKTPHLETAYSYNTMVLDEWRERKMWRLFGGKKNLPPPFRGEKKYSTMWQYGNRYDLPGKKKKRRTKEWHERKE